MAVLPFQRVAGRRLAPPSAPPAVFDTANVRIDQIAAQIKRLMHLRPAVVDVIENLIDDVIDDLEGRPR